MKCITEWTQANFKENIASGEIIVPWVNLKWDRTLTTERLVEILGTSEFEKIRKLCTEIQMNKAKGIYRWPNK